MRTIRECDEALSAYRFDQYARVCYDFFWRDLCDWYVEAVKPALKDPIQAPQTANVLSAALDGAIRLMHPMIPFITETLWWKFNEVRPDRSLGDKLPLPSSHRLIRAAWPTCDESLICDESETVFSKLRDLIVAIRNMRNEHKVDQKKPVIVSIHAPGDVVQHIQANVAIIELLATCAIKQAKTELLPPPDSARSTAAGCEIYIEGLIDEAAEGQRLAKRRDDLTKQIAAMKGRLNNAGYIAKAPAHLVEQTQAQLAEAEAELAKIG
jgi:valyl-tRNA synthetase